MIYGISLEIIIIIVTVIYQLYHCRQRDSLLHNIQGIYTNEKEIERESETVRQRGKKEKEREREGGRKNLSR